jgi:hypothetical protein
VAVKLNCYSIRIMRLPAMQRCVGRVISIRRQSLPAEVVDLIGDIPPAAEIVHRMMTGATQLLAGASNKYRITQ